MIGQKGRRKKEEKRRGRKKIGAKRRIVIEEKHRVEFMGSGGCPKTGTRN